MDDFDNVMRQKIVSILRGDHCREANQSWDTLDVWADASDFYHSLDDARARIAFERVVIDFLHGENTKLRDFAIMMCYELKIRSAIPWLLSFIETFPSDRKIGLVCMALGAMEVVEAVDFFESKGFVFDLYSVNFSRAIPFIQDLINKTCSSGYDRKKAKKIPHSPLEELVNIFYDLYTRFGVSGIIMLLDRLDISSAHQVNFILDAAKNASYRLIGRRRIEAAKQGISFSLEQYEPRIKTDMDEIEQWLSGIC